MVLGQRILRFILKFSLFTLHLHSLKLLGESGVGLLLSISGWHVPESRGTSVRRACDLAKRYDLASHISVAFALLRSIVRTSEFQRLIRDFDRPESFLTGRHLHWQAPFANG